MKPAATLALVTDAWGGRGGIAQYNRDFLAAVAPSSSLRILPRHAPDVAEDLPGTASQAPARAGRVAYAVMALVEALRRPPEVVFCGHLYMAPLAALIARLCGARLIVQTHGIEAWPRPSSTIRRAVEGADLVLAVSRYTRAGVLSWAAIEPDRVAVLPNTVSNRFTPGHRGLARQRFGLKEECVLLTVGRLAASERYKGHDKVIEALPTLIAFGHDLMYLIAGDGDDRSRLEELARSTGVVERVRFLGAVSSAELPDLYRAADIFVMPSTCEGFGIAYLEAMACGTPAVGLRVRGDCDALAPMDRFAEPTQAVSGIAFGDGELRIEGVLEYLSRRNDADASKRIVKEVSSRFGSAIFQRRALAIFRRLMGRSGASVADSGLDCAVG